ncbi:catalase-like protein [Laetiporus sulphureus 93-53]|uniref:Catalase n=1 Tax=Laetiporus sulphureus 93-53 TaxID=1314785 RepID=A0A165DHZ1_9APHY|nr:catalase-like protein [Laetiporus sulphureus 93-53]KZT04923.1 catalase-like protein [Laetiporus sulphureus 93-53]
MMKTALSWAALVAAMTGVASAGGSPGLALPKRADTGVSQAAAPGVSPFSYDMNTGMYMQSQVSSEAAPQLQYTTENGAPYINPYDAWRIGATGPLLLEDYHMTELLGSFDRERIPERVVHAKGAGAHGYFEVTNATFCKQYTMMDMLSEDGLTTPVTVRISTVSGETGASDELRDPRGFAVKFRTRKGILDIVMNNTPVFFIRDPSKFPYFIHTQKRNPQTNLRDKDLFWDFLSSNPESLYQTMILFSDRGTPYGFRHMNAWTGHTYRWIQDDGTWHYVKLYFETMQGVKNFTNTEATYIQGANPDFATQDLFESIANTSFPGWTVYAQVMTPEQAENYTYNVLDLTKGWDDSIPYVEIGRMYLTQNSANYFAEIEQAAFSPSHLVDGWAPSADPMLQARMFAYSDTQRYRLGINHMQIPVNAPITPVANFERGGRMNVAGNQGTRPNYMSTMSRLGLYNRTYTLDSHQQWTGGAVQSLSAVTEIDFAWPRMFWNSLSEQDQQNLISNVIGHLGEVVNQTVRERQVALFAHANYTLGQAIAQGVGVSRITNLTFAYGETWYNHTIYSDSSTLFY